MHILSIVTWFVACVLLAGCVTGNIEWAHRTGTSYTVMYLGDKEYQSLERGYKVERNGGAFLVPPNLVVIRQGSEMFEQAALDHEVGHIREAYEGYAPHTKYAHR